MDQLQRDDGLSEDVLQSLQKLLNEAEPVLVAGDKEQEMAKQLTAMANQLETSDVGLEQQRRNHLAKVLTDIAGRLGN